MSRLPPTNQRGQVAVAMVLILAVLLTISISTAIRTTEEIGISTHQTESTSIFNSADSAVEVALKDGVFSDVETTGSVGGLPEGIEATYTITPRSSYESELKVGQVAEIDLYNDATSAHAASAVIRWNKDVTPLQPKASIIVAVYYANGTVEYHTIGNRDNNEFVAATVINQDGYTTEYTLSFLNPALRPLYMRVMPAYESTKLQVTVAGVGSLAQQHIIRAEAKPTGSADTFERRIIEVTRSLPASPSFMDYSLYATEQIIVN